MHKFETFWRFMVTSLAVWRFSRVFFGIGAGFRFLKGAGNDASTGRFWAVRTADLACWISIWMSSQTAIWVVSGFSGLFICWLTASGVMRIVGLPTSRSRISAAEKPAIACADGMQASHG